MTDVVIAEIEQGQTAEIEPDQTAEVEPDRTAEVEPVVLQELLVEEVSIDGMCGVY